MKEYESYCAKVYEEVYHNWGALLEYVEMQEIMTKIGTTQDKMANL